MKPQGMPFGFELRAERLRVDTERRHSTEPFDKPFDKLMVLSLSKGSWP